MYIYMCVHWISLVLYGLFAWQSRQARHGTLHGADVEGEDDAQRRRALGVGVRLRRRHGGHVAQPGGEEHEVAGPAPSRPRGAELEIACFQEGSRLETLGTPVFERRWAPGRVKEGAAEGWAVALSVRAEIEVL